MGEHFWPSVYPGLLIGLLCGLAMGGRWALLIGALGGFAGAFAAVALTPALYLPTDTLGDFVSLAILAATSFLAAALPIYVYHSAIRPPRITPD